MPALYTENCTGAYIWMPVACSVSLPALEIGAPPTTALRESVLQTLQYDLAQRTNYTLRVGAVTSKVRAPGSTVPLTSLNLEIRSTLADWLISWLAVHTL